MRKLIFLLPLLLLAFGCSKPPKYEINPLVPYGTFAGKFTKTYIDPSTGVKTLTTANIQLGMTQDGFTLTSDAPAIHANGSGEFLGDNANINFTDPNFPSTGTGGKVYLNGMYIYTYDGSAFKLTQYLGYDEYLYELVKK